MLTQDPAPSSQDFEHYKRDGYVVVRNLLPASALTTARLLLEAWVNQQAAEWVASGRLDPAIGDLDFETGLLKAWEAAGKPNYPRSPRKPLVCPAMFHLLKQPELIRVVQALLGSEAIVAHGIFNSRPKLPEQQFTDTPWHQDAQYYRKEERMIHTLSCWFPIVPVDETSSCLAVSPWNRETRQRVFEIDDNVDGTGFLGLRRKDSDKLESVPVPMEPGDVLIFNQLVPHRALSNVQPRIRWSMDFRYQAKDEAGASALEQGFVAADPQHPDNETTCADWLAKWADAAW
ncbi:MAG: phytanoyl-CoA dioxygenase family protein [Opitutales bacterium]